MSDVGKEYGTALYMLAVETGEQKQYAQALSHVRDLFLENPDYLELLASPGISLRERLSSVDAAFVGRVPEHVLSLLKLMCEKGRIACIFEACDAYEALLHAANRVIHATVTTAVPLTVEEKEKLIGKLEKACQGDVIVEYVLDESILGGVIVEADGKIMDGSLRHRLRDVKDVMRA
jgi:F-type H+-transporting ATPase subunit delta